MEGSVNFKNAEANGYVVGTPSYADSEPHHQKINGAWIYETMYHEKTEEILTDIFEKRKAAKISNVYVVWCEKQGTRLMRDTAGNYKPIPIPDWVEVNTDVSSEYEDEASGEFHYYSAELSWNGSEGEKHEQE